jgi:hypothetical protein
VECLGKRVRNGVVLDWRVQCSGVSNLSCLQRDTTLLGFNIDKKSRSLHNRHISMN